MKIYIMYHPKLGYFYDLGEVSGGPYKTRAIAIYQAKRRMVDNV